nr:putative reverse transcriptase domain-containing protein [Tanacetum cinerariifolium]
MCERAYRRASLARIHQAVSAIAKTGNPTDSMEKFQISLVEIHKATKNFSEETHIKRRDDNVGIYKGPIYDRLKKRAAALKVYHPNYRFLLHGVKFRSELEMVSILHHENIAPFMGYCDALGAIVTEYSVNGSLDNQLKDPNKNITWAQRLKICIGVANGLGYLHSGFGEYQRVIHGDFGPVGNKYYMDPVYRQSQICNKESDVYSYGVSSNKEPKTEVTKGLVLDTELMDRVFKVPITIVKFIPHGCRLAFSQALKTVLSKVVVQPDSIDAWARLLLFQDARCRCVCPRIDNNIGPGIKNHCNKVPSLGHLLHGEDDGITTLVKSILDGSALGSFFWVKGFSGSFGHGGCDFLKEGATGNSNIKQCFCNVANGHFMKVIKVLSSFGVAPYSDDTIKALKAKHPYMPPSSMPSITFFEHPIVAENSVFGCIKSFLKNLLKVTTSVDNLWFARRCPPILVEFFTFSLLTPLFKTDNEIRTIAVGTIWRRLVSKVLMKGIKIVYKRHTYLVCYWVPQGDPLGPLLLLLGCTRYYIRSNTVASFFFMFELGLKLNIKKTKIFWPSCNGMKLREDLFPVNIRRPSSGVKLLGGAVSRDAYFISGLAMRRLENPIDLMNLLSRLHDPQSERLLLRSFDATCRVCLKACRNLRLKRSTCELYNWPVSVFRWVGRKHVCVDLTGVSSLVGLSSRGFTTGQAALKAVSCKMTKHEKLCIENQHLFIPFAFDTFGFLAPEAVELLNRVQRVTHINFMTPRYTVIDFKRIDFAVQKGLAA